MLNTVMVFDDSEIDLLFARIVLERSGVAHQRALLLLHHLLDNALKFVAPGQAAEITLTVRHDAGSAWLTVADRGIGISPEQQARLFEPFQRLHLRRDGAGTGLGLALCRQIAQAHGGEISVQSALGDGARFKLRLPLWSGPDGAMRSGLDAAGEPRIG